MRKPQLADQLGWQQSVVQTSHRLRFCRLILLIAGWPTFLANAAPVVKLELYNFAVSGAATNNTALYLTGQPTTIPDFPQQFETFKQYFAQPGGIATSNGTVTWQSNRTLFTIFFGINDVGLEVRNGEDRRIELPQIFGELREIDAMLRQDRRSSWRSLPLFTGTWSNIFSQLYTLGGGGDFLLFSGMTTNQTPETQKNSMLRVQQLATSSSSVSRLPNVRRSSQDYRPTSVHCTSPT